MTAALRQGADGYLLRDISAEALIQTLRGVVRGEAAVPRALVHLLVNALRIGTLGSAGDDLVARLSPRERDVLTEIARSRSNAEIAGRLGLKESTVKTHVSNILRKSGVRSRFALQTTALTDDFPP
jgi:two-component system nitrate/nitrite response regulator NarL